MNDAKVMSDEAVVVGSIMHILMFNIDKSEPIGKIPRKAIMRDIKKQLAKRRTKDYKSFNELVYSSSDIMMEAKDNMIFNGKKLPPLVTPDAMLKFLKFRYRPIFDELNVDMRDIERYSAQIKDVKLIIPSIVFINRVIDKMRKTLYHA